MFIKILFFLSSDLRIVPNMVFLFSYCPKARICVKGWKNADEHKNNYKSTLLFKNVVYYALFQSKNKLIFK